MKNEEVKWIVEKEEVAFKHPFMQVNIQQVRLPDNRVIPDWPIVSLRNYINVVALNESGEFLILKSYKHGIGYSNWQVMGGYMEPDEDPLATAKRELMEETGMVSDEWEFLGEFIVDANRRASEANFFLAKNCRKVAEPDNDDLEDYTIHWHSRGEVEAALTNGQMCGLSYASAMAFALLRLP